MSGSGRKRFSKWDSKEDAKSGSYYREEPEPVQPSNVESDCSRRSGFADDQHPVEDRTRSRISENRDNSYYSEQDDSRQQFFDRSNSRSRSRSRSPVYRARRDAGSYDRHKIRTRVSPLLPDGEFDKKSDDHQNDQRSDYGWEDRIRKPRETKYNPDDFREQGMMRGVRSSDYNSENNSRREHLRDGVSDTRLRRHRSELMGEKETERRDGDGEREFHRSSNIPCKFFASGFCRNGMYCRFSHHSADRKQSQDNNFYRQDKNNHSTPKWNDVERSDNGKFDENEVPRASKGNSEPRTDGSSWIDGMEMSPDWNYGVQSLKDPVKDEHDVGITGQSSQSRVIKDNLVTNYDQRSSGMFPYGDKPMIEKPIDATHHSYDNTINVAPVQVFNHNAQNHNVLPYQNSLTAGGSQLVPAAAAAADVPVGSNLSDPKSGIVTQNNHHLMVEKAVPAQNTVTREQIDQITNISASIAQFLANGQSIPQIKQALQIPSQSESSMAVQPNQATTVLHTQSNSMSSNPNQLWGVAMSTCSEGAPVLTASQVNNVNGIQELAVNPKASEEIRDKKTDEASKEEDKDTKNAKKAVDEEDEDDDRSDEENKKGKDRKGMRAFKFALVEIVKELLKPAWKEGKMNKDGYKNIVKKAVEKVTGTIQSGNIPQTQEKIDSYLSASKPKLTKLVQAYISKVKKN